MTLLRLSYSGIIKKAEIKKVGEKTVAEISLCKKQNGPKDSEPTFCWIRVNIWDPADWLLPKLVKDAYITGSGEFSSRSYEDKEGVKKTSLEVRSISWDVEIGGPAMHAAVPQQQTLAEKPQPRRPASATSDDADQLPF